MIRTAGKILVILLVTALVAAGIYALVQAGSANSAAQGRQFDGRNTGGLARPEGFRDGDRGREGGATAGRGLGGLLVTLLQIGAITFIVVQVQKLLTKPSQRNTPEPV